MRTPVVMTLVLGCTLVFGCSKDEEQPPPATANTYQQQYPAQQQQYPAQQQQYPAQQTQPVQQTVPAAQPAAPAGAAAPVAGQMATPGPLALPCQNDAACGTGKCNLQYQKCAYPCMSQVDCAAGNTCNTVTGFCLPGAAPAQ